MSIVPCPRGQWNYSSPPAAEGSVGRFLKSHPKSHQIQCGVLMCSQGWAPLCRRSSQSVVPRPVATVSPNCSCGLNVFIASLDWYVGAYPPQMWCGGSPFRGGLVCPCEAGAVFLLCERRRRRGRICQRLILCVPASASVGSKSLVGP